MARRRPAAGGKRSTPRAANRTQAARSAGGRRAPDQTAPAPAAKGGSRTEISAGGVVYRPGDEGFEVLLAARRTRRGDLAWGLAKGGIEPTESFEAAAVREVREETGIEAEIEESLGETKYFYIWEGVRVRKTVHFFLMRAIGGDVKDRDDEMEDVRWFPLQRALKRAAYRGEREVLGRAAARLRAR